jgi:hypothetical protein
MATHRDKITFGFLGAMTAIIFGLALYSDFQKPLDRNPASQQEQIEFHPYEYFID